MWRGGWRKQNRKLGLATLWEIELLSGHLLDIWAHVTSVQNYIGSLLSLLWDRFDLLLKLMGCWTHVMGAGCQSHLFWGWHTNSFCIRDVLGVTKTLVKCVCFFIFYFILFIYLFFFFLFLHIKLFVCSHTEHRTFLPVKTDGQLNYV
jgi:hypothetical protein